MAGAKLRLMENVSWEKDRPNFRPIERKTTPLLFGFSFGVELGQPRPGLTEISQAGVGIEGLNAKRVIKGSTNHIEDRFLGGS